MAVTRPTPRERAYFGAVALLALWVGVWGFFVPARVERALPFSVPPLHARFLGAMYLSGFAIMVGSMLARDWEEIRPVPLMTALWTGGLGLISLLHLDTFPSGRVQTWVWFAAYTAYPAIGLALARRHRVPGEAVPGPAVPGPARAYLRGQGAVLVAVAGLLLLLPDTVAPRWPWPITTLLAQIYAAPFLAYGVGSLLLSGRRTLPEVRPAVVGLAVFAAGVLVASIVHRDLFTLREPQDVLWFVLLAAATVALVLIAALRPAPARERAEAAT